MDRASPEEYASDQASSYFTGEVVEKTYNAFCCKDSSGMDGKSFSKLCKDCNLIDKTFQLMQADLIFAAVVPKGQRRIDLKHFCEALTLIAEKKQMDLQDLQLQLQGSEGPVLSGCRPDSVRLHDDKSTYTGTHLRGGPEAGSKGSGSLRVPGLREPASKTKNRSKSLDLSPCSSSNQSLPSGRSGRTSGGSSCDLFLNDIQLHLEEPCQPDMMQSRATLAAVKDAFQSYCGGSTGLDSKSFVRMCRDCNLLDQSDFKNCDCDLIFTKVRKGHHRMFWEQFLLALQEIGRKLNKTEHYIFERVGQLDAPKVSANCTKTESVRFHDDLETYTGSHRHRARASPSPSDDEPRKSTSPDDGTRGLRSPDGSMFARRSPRQESASLSQPAMKCVAAPNFGVALSYLAADFGYEVRRQLDKKDPTFRELQGAFWLKKQVISIGESGDRHNVISTTEGHCLAAGQPLIYHRTSTEECSSELVDGSTVFPCHAGCSTVFTLHGSEQDAATGANALPSAVSGAELMPQGFNNTANFVCPRDGLPGASIIDTLAREQRSRATHFVSWTWDYSIGTLTTALQRAAATSVEKLFLWMCFFVNNQHRIIVGDQTLSPEALASSFVKNMKDIGNLLIVMDNYRDPIYTRRIWTIFEVFEATRNKIKRKVVLPTSCLETLKDDTPRNIREALLQAVNIEEATAWSKRDEEMIKGLIKSQYGGFDFVESSVKESLIQSLAMLFAELLRNDEDKSEQ